MVRGLTGSMSYFIFELLDQHSRRSVVTQSLGFKVQKLRLPEKQAFAGTPTTFFGGTDLDENFENNSSTTFWDVIFDCRSRRTHLRNPRGRPTYTASIDSVAVAARNGWIFTRWDSTIIDLGEHSGTISV